MYVVQCMYECGTFVTANGSKPQLRWCGIHRCAEKAQATSLPPQFKWISERQSSFNIPEE